VRGRRWFEDIRFLDLKDSAMRCPACTSSRLTAIQIRLAPDEDHTFASCQACEWKGWFKEGADVPWARSWPWPANAGSEAIPKAVGVIHSLR
jgi:hypothetical protein